MKRHSYLEKLNIYSSYLWTRNRGKKPLLHTEQKKKIHVFRIHCTDFLQRVVKINVYLSDAYVFLFTIKMQTVASSGINESVQTSINKGFSFRGSERRKRKLLSQLLPPSVKASDWDSWTHGLGLSRWCCCSTRSKGRGQLYSALEPRT